VDQMYLFSSDGFNACDDHVRVYPSFKKEIQVVHDRWRHDKRMTNGPMLFCQYTLVNNWFPICPGGQQVTIDPGKVGFTLPAVKVCGRQWEYKRVLPAGTYGSTLPSCSPLPCLSIAPALLSLDLTPPSLCSPLALPPRPYLPSLPLLASLSSIRKVYEI